MREKPSPALGGGCFFVTIAVILSYHSKKKNVIRMSFSLIPIRDLEKYNGRPGTILIDLRNSKDYEKGHIEGAKNIPYEQWQKEKDVWNRRYETVVFYCDRGNLSMYAARDRNRSGYRAISIAGGYQGYEVWKKERKDSTG